MKSYTTIILLILMTAVHAEIVIKPVISKTKPELDGKYDSAWYEKDQYEFRRIDFEHPIKLRTLIHEDSIYFLIQWKDETHNKLHKPWRWDGQKEAYIVGAEREDSLVVRWAVNIDNERINSANDLWMWGSVRANQGYADDLYEIVSKKPLQKSVKNVDFEGEVYYLQSQGDVGRRCYSTLFEDTAFWLNSRYTPVRPTESRADVKAMAFWKSTEDEWTIEIERKLSTTNFDDVEFEWEKTYYFDICKKLLGNAHLVHDIELFNDGLKPQDRTPLVLRMPKAPKVEKAEAPQKGEDSVEKKERDEKN